MRNVSFTRVVCAHHGYNALWVRSGDHVSFTHGLVTDLGTGAVRVGGLGQTDKRINMNLNGGRKKFSDAPDTKPSIDVLPNTNHDKHQTSASHVDLDLTSFNHTKDQPQPNSQVRHVLISDSILSDGGWVFPSGTAVLVQGGAMNVTITHNEIRQFSYTAISLGWDWSYRKLSHTGKHVVTANHIHHLGYPRRETGDAMACVYTLGRQNGTVVDGNLCHDVRAYMSGGECHYAFDLNRRSKYVREGRHIHVTTTGKHKNGRTFPRVQTDSCAYLLLTTHTSPNTHTHTRLLPKPGPRVIECSLHQQRLSAHNGLAA